MNNSLTFGGKDYLAHTKIYINILSFLSFLYFLNYFYILQTKFKKKIRKEIEKKSVHNVYKSCKMNPYKILDELY